MAFKFKYSYSGQKAEAINEAIHLAKQKEGGEGVLRVRFKANLEDSRPIKWPVKHPWWETGYDDENAIVISYADDEQYIYDNWPEAKDLDIELRDTYTFTDRFPKPDWFEG